MTKRGGSAGEKQQSLGSIRLEDFPENEDLASSYFDWEYDDFRGDNDEEEGTVVMKKADFLAEEDFIEKSLQMIDDEPSEELEDFTLKLDPKYFDQSEDELAFLKPEPVSDESIADVIRKKLNASDSHTQAPSLRPAKGAPRPQVSSRNTPAKASAQAKRRQSQSTDENGSHSSVARLFADEEDTVKLSKASASRVKEETKEEVEEMKPARKTASGLSGQGQKKKSSPSRAQISRAPQSRNGSSSAKKSSGSSSGSTKGSSTRSSSAGRSSSARSSSGSSSQASRPRSSQNTRNRREKKKPIGLRVAKFFIFLLLWIAVAVVCYKGYQFAYDIFYDVAIDPADISKIEVTLKGNEDDDQVGQILLDNGLIDDLKIYKYRCKIYKSDYRSGTFKLSRSFNTEKIVNILSGYSYADGRMEEEETETASDTEGESAAGEGEGEWQEGEAPQDEGGDEEN